MISKKNNNFFGKIFENSKHVQQFYEGLHTFCTNFLRFGTDFHQIKTFGVGPQKSKLLGLVPKNFWGCGCTSSTPASYISEVK